jgi:hypothetical protein
MTNGGPVKKTNIDRLASQNALLLGMVREEPMTSRKSDAKLPSRTPAYVDRETGAAELIISPETWDRWVAAGILPPVAPGFPETTPRWRWADVDRKMSGGTASGADAFIAAASKLREP